MPQRTPLRFLAVFLTLLVTACAVSPETQAKIEAYNNSIPICSATADCAAKWQAARRWALENSDFPILTESDDRIMASSTLMSMRGVGVVVTRETAAGGDYQLLVDIECFSAYGCPDAWDLKLDFNQTVAGR